MCFRDVIVKTVKVELEGFPIENTKSSFVCIDGNISIIIN